VKSDWQIQAYYENALDFYGDNSTAAWEEMVYFRKMLAEAHHFVLLHQGDPKANEWLRKFDGIEEAEDQV